VCKCNPIFYEIDSMLVMLARGKHPSLLGILINYGHKKFYNIGPC